LNSVVEGGKDSHEGHEGHKGNVKVVLTDRFPKRSTIVKSILINLRDSLTFVTFVTFV